MSSTTPTNATNTTTGTIGTTTNVETELLNFALGDPECDNTTASRVIDRLTLPLLGTLTFVLLSLPSVDLSLSKLVPSFYHRLFVKALIFLIIIYIIDRLLVAWREDKELC